MDNLSSHQAQGAVETIESTKARVLYLPPDRPDFNPIEQAFSKLKQLIRSAKQRTVEGVWNVCGNVLENINESEFHNYIKNAGYRYT